MKNFCSLLSEFLLIVPILAIAVQCSGNFSSRCKHPCATQSGKEVEENSHQWDLLEDAQGYKLKNWECRTPGEHFEGGVFRLLFTKDQEDSNESITFHDTDDEGLILDPMEDGDRQIHEFLRKCGGHAFLVLVVICLMVQSIVNHLIR